MIANPSSYKKKKTAVVVLQWKNLSLFSSLICFWTPFSSLHLAENFNRKFKFMQHHLHWRRAGMEKLHTPGHTDDSEWPGRVNSLEKKSKEQKSLFLEDEKLQLFYVKNLIALREWRDKSQTERKYCKTRIWWRTSMQNIQRALRLQKLGKRPKLTPHQRRYTDRK